MGFCFSRRMTLALMAVGMGLASFPMRAQAWSHQGHILISRLAALRIIQDPNAPQGLRDFLKANMKYDMEGCRKLAVEEMVGGNGTNYLAGLDGACTLPDRIQSTKEGRETVIEPYGIVEGKGMHFMDMEWLSADPAYKADLSNRPKPSEVPHDVKDPRWKMAGFVPFRVEEFYGKTVTAIGPGEKLADEKEALHSLGYLIHYIEDAHQPQHATIDFRSYSYLAGKVAKVHKVTTTTSDGKEVVSYRVEGKDNFSKINPHGDLEFQLFENADSPRKEFREEFWRELTARIDAKAKKEAAGPVEPHARYGSFVRTLEILSKSYEYLPAIGKAAQAAYATGTFDAKAFFTSEDTVNGEKMDIVQLIAERNASAVLEVEKTIRAVWAEAHPVK